MLGGAGGMSDDICSVCGQLVLAGQEIHGGRGDHWGCVYPPERPYQTLKEIIAKGDAAMAALCKEAGIKPRKMKCREGEGATAQKCKRWAEEALTTLIGKAVTIRSLWNQQGIYRGPRWDLDSWGATFEIAGVSHGGNASSLATMTQCVKSGGIIAKHSDSGGAWSFDLYPLKDAPSESLTLLRSYKRG